MTAPHRKTVIAFAAGMLTAAFAAAGYVWWAQRDIPPPPDPRVIQVRGDIRLLLPLAREMADAAPGAIYMGRYRPDRVFPAAEKAGRETDLDGLCQTYAGLRAVHASATLAYGTARLGQPDGPIDLEKHTRALTSIGASEQICGGRMIPLPGIFN